MMSPQACGRAESESEFLEEGNLASDIDTWHAQAVTSGRALRLEDGRGGKGRVGM